MNDNGAVTDCRLERRGGGMVDHPGRFAWYELVTTDVAAARAFYADVVGWGAQDASTPGLAYTLITAGEASVGGLMDLPEDAQKLGATPRWIGYVAVDDVANVAGEIKRRGGAVFVPPTDSNIGRIAVVADPQAASLALVEGLKYGEPQQGRLREPGHVGWHELFADDQEKAFAFYSELFGWRKAGDQTVPTGTAETYRLFSAGAQTIGGVQARPDWAPSAFWLYYFNVGDIDTALQRVTAGGGHIFGGPHELPGGNWFARCTDPQGAGFALQGPRNKDAVAWSSSWGEFSSKGRLITRR
jgi:predicted enzyme related to lactoylglutathione lyase